MPSLLTPARRIPRLFKENEDLSPRIANAPSVRKYEAQKALEPILNTILGVAPLSALAQAASYSPEAEASSKNPLSLVSQVARALRRTLTPDEIAKLAKAENQGYNTVGWHWGDFTKDLPSSFPETGEQSLFHIDLSPYGSQALAREAFSNRRDLSHFSPEVVVARTEKTKKLRDERANSLLSGEKGEADSFIYPNTSEMSPRTQYTKIKGEDVPIFEPGEPILKLVETHPLSSNVTINPSIGISNPSRVRLWNAEFDPDKVDEVGYRLAQGGSVKSTLQRYKESFPQRRAEANRQASVMSRAEEPGWVPEYQREPALEAPMISPDDLIGTGIPTKLAMLAKAGLGKGALGALGAGVIKNKGGNWLEGSVEGALSGLKRNSVSNVNRIEKVSENPEAIRELWRSYVRKPVGDTLGFPEWVVKHRPDLAGDVVRADPAPYALNNWIDKQLTRYVKNEMATPEDPIRALAERGVLHIAPETVNPNIADAAGRMRQLADGFVRVPGLNTPGQVMGETPLARTWENISDTAIGTQPVSVRKKYESQLESSPWMAKLPEDTLVHHFNRSDSIGFNHLIDELSNAINPESGLPRELLFPANRLDKVSVPQAVERVAKINEWRAAMAKAAKKAAAEGIPVRKEYPEGYKWLDVPDTADEKAHNFATECGLEGGWCTQSAEKAKMYGSEGGGRLHILTGPDGSAHVQIHTRPVARKTYTNAFGNSREYDDFADYLSRVPELGGDLRGLVEDYGGDFNKLFVQAEDPTLLDKFLAKHYPDYAEEYKKTLLPEDSGWEINEIKGKQNRAPNPEYLPFVQDFVKSEKWSDVGDLHNTGLRRSRDAFNELERQKLQEAGHTINEYLSPEEIEGLQSKFGQRFASGGSVRPNKIETAEQLRAIIAAIQSGMQNA